MRKEQVNQNQRTKKLIYNVDLIDFILSIQLKTDN